MKLSIGLFFIHLYLLTFIEAVTNSVTGEGSAHSLENTQSIVYTFTSPDGKEIKVKC